MFENFDNLIKSLNETPIQQAPTQTCPNCYRPMQLQWTPYGYNFICTFCFTKSTNARW